MALGIVGIIFIAFAPQIVSVFTADPEPARYGIMCLRIVRLGFLFYAYGMVLTESFNGAGDTWTPTVINIFCFWLFEIPLAAWLAYGLGRGPTGVFWAVMLGFSMVAVVSGFWFRLGRWKSVQI